MRKKTTKPPHVVAVDATREAIAAILPPDWWLRDEKPVRIPEFDEPEPDVSVVRGSRQDYRSRHPVPGDIEFLVEVSDTSLLWDRREKLSAYARAGVPTYWIVNLVDRQLEVFTAPDSTGYQARQILGPADRTRLSSTVSKWARSTSPTCSRDRITQKMARDAVGRTTSDGPSRSPHSTLSLPNLFVFPSCLPAFLINRSSFFVPHSSSPLNPHCSKTTCHSFPEPHRPSHRGGPLRTSCLQSSRRPATDV